MRKVKTINSHVGVSRFLAECAETNTYLPLYLVRHIPSPYAYSPTKTILRWRDMDVVWFETRHKHYEVYEVPADFVRFDSDDAATDANTEFNRKHS